MTDYLGKAAEELRSAGKNLNQDGPPGAVFYARLRLAEVWVDLAAVEKGLPPGPRQPVSPPAQP